MYKVRSTAYENNLKVSLIEQSVTAANCQTVIELSNSVGTPLDPSIFSFQLPQYIIRIETSDPSHVGTYSLRLTAYSEGYFNLSNFDFQVDIIDTCATATLDMSPMLGTYFDLPIEYKVKSSALQKDLDLYLVESSETEVNCPSTLFELRYSNGTALDSNIFSFNSGSGIIQMETNDIASVGEYSLTFTANSEGYSNLSYFDFEVNIIDSCATATLDMSPMLGNALDVPIEYKVTSTAYENSLSTSLIESSETTVICPATIMELRNSDGTVIDP